MATVFTAPEKIHYTQNLKTIFLAGSIEQGKADDWQQEIIKELARYNCLILNPRRKQWDSSWEQTIDNPLFYEQVEWELSAQEQADIIAMYFAPNTLAPISLLELGLFAASQKLVVCCPLPYWRKGNVDIVCKKYNIPTVNNLAELISFLKNKLQITT